MHPGDNCYDPINSSMSLCHQVIHFAAYLRQHDIPTSQSAIIDATETLSHGFFSSHQLTRSGLRTCFCKRRSDWERFNLLFETFWASELIWEDSLDDTDSNDDSELRDSDRESSQNRLVGFAGVSSLEAENTLFGAGDFKALSLSDFRFVFDPQQQHEIGKLVDSIARRSRRRFFRQDKIRSHGYRIAMHKSMKKSVRNRGQIVSFKFRQRQRRLPKFVLLIDVSQSMDVYAKIFLRFTRQLMTSFEQSEAFAFNTHLMPLGSGFAQLTETEFEQRINDQSGSWLGGTRIASSFAEFNTEYARRSINSKTTVVVFSDGCDTAKHDELLPELAAIQRRAGKLIWVNPLLGRFSPGEKDRDMDPLQIHIDVYRSAHNLESLQMLEGEFLGR